MKCTECPDYLKCSRTKDLRRFRKQCPKAKEEKVFTYADRIRSMSDEELTAAIYCLIYAKDPAMWFCKGSKECGEMMDNDQDIPEEMCRKCLLQKLQQPAEEE